MRRRTSSALALSVLMALNACSSADEPQGGESPSAALSASADPLMAFHEQSIAWGPCAVPASSEGSSAPADAGECGTVTVPVDYGDVSAGDVSIAVVRYPATGTARASLLVNPGGPGDSGVKFATSLAGKLPAPIRASYDLVGFDPRGVGASDPLACADTAQLDAFIAADMTPDTPAAEAQVADQVAALGAGCEQGSGALASHVTTIETARDLDIVRAALGDEKLTYLGKSYGTFLGAMYAALFPGLVDRMVLDGAVDPSLTQAEILLGQTSGFETALRAYAASCVSGGDCPAGSSVDEVIDGVRDLLTRVDGDPLPTSLPGRVLTQTQAYYAITGALYAEELWPLLTQGLEYAADGSGDGLLLLSDLYAQRGQDGYESNIFTANMAINCLDDQTKGQPAAIPAERFVEASPTFGAIIAGMARVGCAGWPLTTDLTAPDYSAATTAPVLVIGTTRDPATIYPWAEALAATLPAGVLVSRDGDGHTGFLQGNDCVDQAVVGYLVDDTVPKDGTRC